MGFGVFGSDCFVLFFVQFWPPCDLSSICDMNTPENNQLVSLEVSLYMHWHTHKNTYCNCVELYFKLPPKTLYHVLRRASRAASRALVPAQICSVGGRAREYENMQLTAEWFTCFTSRRGVILPSAIRFECTVKTEVHSQLCRVSRLCSVLCRNPNRMLGGGLCPIQWKLFVWRGELGTCARTISALNLLTHQRYGLCFASGWVVNKLSRECGEFLFGGVLKGKRFPNIHFRCYSIYACIFVEHTLS